MNPSPHSANQLTPSSWPASILDRLTAAIGIDPSALDSSRLKWILGSRCRQLKLPDAFAYAAFLNQNAGEIDVLIDQVVVPETRFFRDPAVFDHIRAALTQMAATADGPLRILSAPCGTGQEAYSLAATLAHVGVEPARFSIDAIDISLCALDIARRGVYPEHALTHVSPELQHACGIRRQKNWEMHERLRERIHFERRNLAEPRSLGTEAKYHLILCRNLFIYLRREARTALAQSLAAALLPGGRLVVGTADRVEELSSLFAPLRPASSFAFVHRASVAERPRVSGINPPSRSHAGRRAVSLSSGVAASGAAPRTASGPASGVASGVATRPPGGTDFAAAPLGAAVALYKRALEDRQHGELTKAERRCRQALYLEPTYLPALELLQSLWSQSPNLRLRRALRDRILRNRPGVPEPPSAPCKEPA